MKINKISLCDSRITLGCPERLQI